MAKANDVINWKGLIEQAGPLVITTSLLKPQRNLDSWERGVWLQYLLVMLEEEFTRWRSLPEADLAKEVILVWEWPISHTSCIYLKTREQMEAFWKALDCSGVAQGSSLHGISPSQGLTTVTTNDWEQNTITISMSDIDTVISILRLLFSTVCLNYFLQYVKSHLADFHQRK